MEEKTKIMSKPALLAPVLPTGFGWRLLKDDNLVILEFLDIQGKDEEGRPISVPIANIVITKNLAQQLKKALDEFLKEEK